MLFVGLGGCGRGPVSREEAKSTADAYFVELTSKEKQQVADFLPAQVAATPEGWEFRYRLKRDQRRAYEIFVTRSGETDVNLTPDE